VPVPQQPRYVITGRTITETPGAGRLGRHFRHDSRSAAYPYQAVPGRVPIAVEHPRHIGVLDQGDVGSCEGNAVVGVLATDPFWESLKPGVQGQLGEPLAQQLYSAGEDIDGDGPWTTNTSISQAAKNAGLIAGYVHVATVADMIDALQARPLFAGVNWYASFDTPDPDTGVVTIAHGASIRGGHAFVVRGVDPAAGRFKADNSWGPDWGIGGSFWIPFGIMGRLLAEEGEVTAPVPVTAPAPVPVPNPPAPPPVPAVYPADIEFVRRMDPWSDLPHSAQHAVHAYRQWKTARGITSARATLPPGGQLEPGGAG
jgi:hypothetical protein